MRVTLAFAYQRAAAAICLSMTTVVIASMLREEGATGVQTHVRQLRAGLAGTGTGVVLLTPFSWARPLTYPVFGIRLVFGRLSGDASVWWYRKWHEVFLCQALRRELGRLGDCVVYAQGPPEARAALRARRGPHQRVVMAVHFKTSQADEWVDTRTSPIKQGGRVYRGIRRAEREAITRLDGILYVAAWARNALQSWLPEAATVPSAVIGNFTAPVDPEPALGPVADLVTIGALDSVKNHTYLLDVLAEAKRRGRTITLDVYGDGVLRAELQEKTRALGLADQVRWRGFRRDVRQFRPGYKVYVHPAYSEVSPFAIVEAMAAGLPIVAGRVGGITETYDDGVEGRFWPMDDAAGAARILLDLLDSETARLAAAEAARERFYRDFNAAVVVPRLLSFLRGKVPSTA
jgi:glycosyltransferase involved in cell wall biosynthesis